jgi:carboxyl-terminal processing protease
MQHRRLWTLVLAIALAIAAPLPAAKPEQDDGRLGEIAQTVGRMLESAHYSRQRLNQEVEPGVTQARKALERYLELLDYNRLFFTQADIDEFISKHGEWIHEDILGGNLQPAYAIYDRFLRSVEDRVGKINALLDKGFTFDSERTAQINRDKEPWPANEAEADRIWSDRLEAELLQAILAEQALEESAAKKRAEAEADGSEVEPDEDAPAAPKRTPVETIRKRYERLLKTLQEETREDQANTFLSALAQSYDPHSEYMSQRALDNFNIQMGLSLVGIGAVLRSEDGYAKIVELVPGGPADRGGQLKENDRIVAVAQGDAEFEDVVDMKLDKVVERIRGKKGTTVRLQVMPAASLDPSKLTVISIVRDEVQLKDQQAKAQVIDTLDSDGADTRIGWITLPSFYANMNQRGQPARSTTKDVAALLKRLKKEGIEGLVIDLRRDSGGSLEEAIRMTGLFIPKGPVVQAKDTDGNITPMNDSDPGVMWDGPLIVLMNRLSASASEIFAAALQDYGRAVVVGDEQSFGKGTVQTLIDVQRFMPLFAQTRDAGAVKLTIQKFYRVKGGSTQLRGVASDIVLPSLTDHEDVGEGSLKNPLGYDEVPARRFTPSGNIGALVPRLRSASEARVAASPEFDYVQEDRERLRLRIEENEVSLNKSERLAEIEEDKARREARIAERKKRGAPELFAMEVTLDTVDAPELQKVSLDKPPKSSYGDAAEEEDPSAPDEEEPFVDPVRDETLLIMQDYIRLVGPEPVTARAAGAEKATP